jgi:hypothetical protein
MQKMVSIVRVINKQGLHGEYVEDGGMQTNNIASQLISKSLEPQNQFKIRKSEANITGKKALNIRPN